MRYDVRRRTLTLERTKCRYCDKGKVAGRSPCPTCWGTGSGPRGGKGGCHPCHGEGDLPDRDNLETCTFCSGEWEKGSPERWTDHVPKQVMELMPLAVLRVARHNTWHENYLGMGALFTVQDYGKAAHTSDDVLVEQVRKDLIARPPQACKIVAQGAETRKPVARSLIITVTTDGYAVRAEGLVTRVPEPEAVVPVRSTLRPIGDHVNACPHCFLVHPGECE